MSSNTFFTSDTHFDHKKIATFCPRSRPQNCSAEEMTEHMIQRWNKVVPPTGTVYHLGDFSFSWDKQRTQEIIKRLNGQIHLILGNHDEVIIKNREEFLNYFYTIQDYKEIRVNKQKICLFHFPMAVWHKNHRDSWHLYGHCHGSYPGFGRGKTMDVGWDTNDMKGYPHIPGPVSFEQIKEVLDNRQAFFPDHHNHESAARSNEMD